MTKDYKVKRFFYGLSFAAAFFMFLPRVGAFFNYHGYWWLCILIRGFLLSNILVPLAIWASFKFNVLDMPDERRVHERPTPRSGGIAVFTAVYVLTLQYWKFDTQLLGICLASSVIFVMGLADDIKGLPSSLRLAGQLAASSIIIYFGISITFIPDHWFAARALEIIVTVFWIVGVTNAVNFLDGIDGLVASLGIVCSFIFFVLAMATYQRYVAYLCVALGSACLGFLFYNFKFWRKNQKGSIFLGDSGSTLIGFMLASIAIMGTWASRNPLVALSTPILVLGVAIFDMIYITISRFTNGQVRTVKQWLDYVGKDHFHHRLMKMGMSERKAVFFITLVTVILGLAAIVIPCSGQIGAKVLLLQAVCLFVCIIILMRSGREVVSKDAE